MIEIIVIWLMPILLQGSEVSAIVFSSSIGFYNYRQTANSLAVYQYLKANGFNDRQILLIIPQNTGCCEKNQILGTVSFIDNDYKNINSKVQIDRKFSSISLKGFTDSIRSKYPHYLPNKNRLEKSKRLLIYQTGHGGDFYFKIREREAITHQHYQFIFQELMERKLYDSIFVLSDSCSAITVFQTLSANNVICLGSSSLNQKSLSHGFDNRLNAPKSDDFTFYMIEYLNSVVSQKSTIQDLFHYLDYTKLKVNSKIVTNNISKKEPLNKYFKNSIDVKTRKFILPSE